MPWRQKEPYSITELTDVYSSMSPSDGEVLTYDTTNGWQAEGVSASGGFTLGTPVDTSTNEGSYTYSGIPSTATQIVLMLDSVSISGSDNIFMQIGTTGGMTGSGYSSSAGVLEASAQSAASLSSGFLLVPSSAVATADQFTGSITLTKMTTGHKWSSSGVLRNSNTAGVYPSAGLVDLTNYLERLSIEAGGSTTFDNGEINISYV